MPDPFSLDSLQKAINDALATPATSIPTGHSTALVSVIDGDAARLTVAHKINDTWQVDANVEHSWQGPAVQGSVVVHASW